MEVLGSGAECQAFEEAIRGRRKRIGQGAGGCDFEGANDQLFGSGIAEQDLGGEKMGGGVVRLGAQGDEDMAGRLLCLAFLEEPVG